MLLKLVSGVVALALAAKLSLVMWGLIRWFSLLTWMYRVGGGNGLWEVYTLDDEDGCE